MIPISAPQRDEASDFQMVRVNRSAERADVLARLESVVMHRYNQYGALARARQAEPLEFSETDGDILRTCFDALGSGRSLSSLRADIIFSNDGLCGLCSVSDASAIDHFLPRKFYPEFAILARNLVPACARCNSLKGEKCPHYVTGTPPFLHPYYRESADGFLKATVGVRYGVASVRFYVEQPVGMTDAEFESVQHHFVELAIGRNCLRQATREIADLREAHVSLASSAGTSVLVEELHRQASSFEARRGLNYWRAVLYRALAQSVSYLSLLLSHAGIRTAE